MHKDKRVIEYFPQDDKLEFSTRPQIMGREKKTLTGTYDFEAGGQSFTHRVPTNLVGDNLRTGRKDTDAFNGHLL